jgi:oligopeptide/dipeptide ABC transporter ATP-binding protein
MTAPLLEVDALRVTFATDIGVIPAVNGVSFTVQPREMLALVGESGSGKSVTGLSIMRLTPRGAGCRVQGKIRFRSTELLDLPEKEMRAIRGNRISMIFQEPMTSLNPVKTIGEQIAEAIRCHRDIGHAGALDRAAELLDLVGIPDARQRLQSYPHHMSGGMRQRAMIAMALACEPDLLIADEPTTALDVTIQAQILELLRELQQRFGTSILLITHDLGVVAETVSRVIVMYGGEIVEEASVVDLFAHAHHPYTEGLLNAMPQVGQERERLATIPGSVPPPTAWPAGCRFHDRCPYAWDRCLAEHPPLYQIGEHHVSRCHLADEPQRRADRHEPLVVQQAGS